jgi:hypothetical protein
MDTSPLTVLCITGWCRNGSTIIGNVLNEVPGFFHVGELHFLWKNSVGHGQNTVCGCGRPLTRCPVWSVVLDQVRPPGWSAAEQAELVVRRQRAHVRTRHTWRVLARGLRGEGIHGHADLMARTYRAAADLAGARVIVDTTKIPGEAALLPHLPGITPYYVHLVRDPRAVAQSWSRPKAYVYALPAWRSTAYWHGFNRAAAAVTRRYPGRSVFLSYERFIADPSAVVAGLLRLCQADPASNPLRDREIELHANHTVTGNPDRLVTGTTRIRDRDDAWRARLPAGARLATAALSWPLFHRYGYRHRGGHSHPYQQERDRWI